MSTTTALRFNLPYITMKCIFVGTLTFILLLLLLRRRVSCLPCPLQVTGSGEVEPVMMCAMCSDSAAAVRWTIREDKIFDFMKIRYSCTDRNGSEIYTESSPGEDTCFKEYPDWRTEKTGASSIGYSLSAGVQCEFRMLYRVDHRTSIERQNCIIQTPEACTANPDECQVDSLSKMNEEGVCQYACTEGLAGELCNNINECYNQTVCDENADCHDTDGSYWCQCRPGFTGDGYNCTDINECEALSDGCADENAHCVDSVGNFTCQCNPGFTGDGYNCSAVPVHSECELLSCDVDAECVYNNSRYQCKCSAGYDGDGHTCSASMCSHVGDTCHKENTVCQRDAVNLEIYRCSCLPGFRDVDGDCIDVDECREGMFLCADNSSCVNLIGSYQCKSYMASSVDATLIVAIGSTCGTFFLLLLLAVGVFTAAYWHLKHKGKKMLPFFQDITKKSLDPYYTPSFWNGSLTSVHSVYEKLTSSSSAVERFEKLEYQRDINEDMVSITICEQESLHTVSHSMESVENELHTLPTADQSLDYVQEVTTHTHVSGKMTSEAKVTDVGVLDDQVSVGKTETAQDIHQTPGKSICREAGVLTKCNILLPSPTLSLASELVVTSTSPANSAYIHMSDSGSMASNLYCVPGSGSTTTEGTAGELKQGRELRPSQDPEEAHRTDYSADGTVSSSGYVTESETFSNNFQRQCSYSLDSPTCKRKKLNVFQYDSFSSSGYASEYAMGDPESHNMGGCSIELRPWNSQTSLQSDNADKTASLGVWDMVNAVSFSVNGRQEFEYVNKLQESFYNDIIFDIVP